MDSEIHQNDRYRSHGLTTRKHEQNETIHCFHYAQPSQESQNSRKIQCEVSGQTESVHNILAHGSNIIH